ncbi:MAG: hypothetical protein WCA46_09320, partial [Actinocatenispora sp.]
MRAITSAVTVFAGVVLAASLAVPAVADDATGTPGRSPSPSSSASPSSAPSASPSPSGPVDASPSPDAPARTTDDLTVTAAFDRDVVYPQETVDLNVTVTRSADGPAGVLQIGHLFGTIEYRSVHSNGSCAQKEPDDLVVCELPPGVRSLTCRVTYEYVEVLTSHPIRYTQFATATVDGHSVSKVAAVTLEIRSAPSESPSTSPSSSPSGPAASPSGTPGGGDASGGLPVTGTSLALFGGVGAVLLGLGGGL